jgi:hypothetical protein
VQQQQQEQQPDVQQQQEQPAVGRPGQEDQQLDNALPPSFFHTKKFDIKQKQNAK